MARPKNIFNGGRPTKFTPELADLICKRVSEGETLLRICKEEDMPVRSTVHEWLLNTGDPKMKLFSDNYEKAVNARAELMAEELMEISDDGSNDYMIRTGKNGREYETINTEHVQRSKLRVDTRKWYLSKIMPKKYGEKLDLTSDGKPVLPIAGMKIIIENGHSISDKKS